MASEQQTLRDLLTTRARRYEKKTFLEYRGQSFSFRTVDDKTDRVASGLSRLGLRPRDRVALLLSNRPEFVFFFLGAAKMGAVPVPLNPAWPQKTILDAVQESQASAFVTERSFTESVLEMISRSPRVRSWILAGNESPVDGPFRSLLEEPVLGFWPDLSPEDAAAILYTSGTTAPPKAVLLTHRNFVSNCLQAVQPFRVDETDRFFCWLPLSSSTAQVLLVLTPWAAGAACVLGEFFSPRAILDELSEKRITVLAGAPHFFADLVQAGDASRDIPSLRLAICNTGSVGQTTLRAFEDRYEAFVVEGYGLVEATCICCANPYTGRRKAGSVGLPLPGEQCRVVGESGGDCAVGEPGEILIRGPNIMKGYYNDPASSARTLREGWLHTGDLGRIDSDGYYYLIGRKQP